MTRAPTKPPRFLRTLLVLGVAAGLAAALPLAPYLLAEGGPQQGSSPGGQPHHGQLHHGQAHHSDSSSQEGAPHPHCLKCVVAASSLPAATEAPSAAEACSSFASHYAAPHLELLFAHSAEARAPPSA